MPTETTETTMEPGGREQLQRLYTEYKGLAISIGATLAMGHSAEPALADVRRLASRCDGALEACEPGLQPQLRACLEAADRLADVAAAEASTERLSAARSSHSRLRALVWEVLPCEYVPCSAHGAKHEGHPGAIPATPERSQR